jgi:FF domain/WW domain
MLKSTYNKEAVVEEQSAPSGEPPLAKGWTAHKAPSGHTYYYHAETKKSTYTRPVEVPSYSPASLPNHGPGQSQFAHRMPHDQPGAWSDSRRQEPSSQKPLNQPRLELEDRPKHRNKIPGAKPWVIVRTKLGRRFVHNTDTGESFWKFPDHVLKQVIEFDRLLREGRLPADSDEEVKADAEQDEGSSEYEEIEVTDNEGEEDAEDKQEAENRYKRQRTEEDEFDGPVEFGEDDLAWELEELENEFEGQEDELTEEDCRLLFFDLLDDFKISPYSTWEKVVEDGEIVEDSRYTALPNMRSRRSAWDDWSLARIQQLKELRESQEKKDPRIPYFTLLQDSASTKLYWPEFKRKFKKEEAMKTSKLSDKDREKWYREHIKRLQMPSSQLKSDLKDLLKSLPLSGLNRDTSMTALPAGLLTDLRYISLPPKSRDPMIEAFISTLPSDPGESANAEAETLAQANKDRKRREKALAERERKVEEQKLQQKRDLYHERTRLRQEEENLSRAFDVGSRGLKSHFDDNDEDS